MLQEASDKIAADVSRRRIQTGSKTEEARLKAGAQGDLQKLVPVDVLKNKIDIVRTKDGFTLNVRIELSYVAAPRPILKYWSVTVSLSTSAIALTQGGVAGMGARS